MPDAKNWSKLIDDAEKAKTIEAHLQNPVSVDAWLGLKILDLPLQMIQDLTCLEHPPTEVWYALHSCVNNERKWKHWDMAWGLNLFRPDLHVIQRRMIAFIMNCRQEANERNEVLDPTTLTQDMASLMQREYSKMARRFEAATVPTYWYLDAQNTLIRRCISDAETMLHWGYYDKNSSQLTTIGEDMWAELHQKSMSTEEFISSTFAVLRDSEDTTSPQMCTPSLQGIPQELRDMIIDHALPTRSLGAESRLPPWTRANRMIRASAEGSYSRTKTCVVKAQYWPEEAFPLENLPVEWLQEVETVCFDYDGLRFRDRFASHPVIEQLASIWKKKNRLRSIIIPSPPSQESLLAPEPKLEHCQGVDLPFLLLSELDNVKIDYVFDFRAPAVESGMNILCYVAYKTSESRSPLALPSLLEMSKAYINEKSSDFSDIARTPLHYALNKYDTTNLRLLLEVEGVDVNSKDSRGYTPMEAACKEGWNEPVWILMHIREVRVTTSAFRDAKRNRMWPEIVSRLHELILLDDKKYSD
jgi:hypothetical protein